MEEGRQWEKEAVRGRREGDGRKRRKKWRREGSELKRGNCRMELAAGVYLLLLQLQDLGLGVGGGRFERLIAMLQHCVTLLNKPASVCTRGMNKELTRG